MKYLILMFLYLNFTGIHDIESNLKSLVSILFIGIALDIILYIIKKVISE